MTIKYYTQSQIDQQASVIGQRLRGITSDLTELVNSTVSKPASTINSFLAALEEGFNPVIRLAKDYLGTGWYKATDTGTVFSKDVPEGETKSFKSGGTEYVSVYKPEDAKLYGERAATSNLTDMASLYMNHPSEVDISSWDTSNVLMMTNTWNSARNWSTMPLLNTSKVDNFQSAWFNCSSLSEFPAINTTAATSFYQTWYGCSGLTEFPMIDTSSGRAFHKAWEGCSGLTSFPAIDLSQALSLQGVWKDCTSLTVFPPNMFDNIKTGNLTEIFTNTNLNEESIDGILVSLVASNQLYTERTFNQSGGSAPSSIGTAAIDTLRSQGWTVTVTGGY